MTQNTSKGFTIIELLVVVAIIAVLAAIVLVNVTGYINQGKNAAIKGNLSTVLTNGAVYYDANSNYGSSGTGFCGTANFTSPSAAITAAGGTAVCDVNDAYTAWCACSTLKVTSADIAGSTFCTDHTGYKKVTQNAGGCAARCVTPNNGVCID
jgi:prepilin-type N-terminal cleavage/methylation domain-containing protein